MTFNSDVYDMRVTVNNYVNQVDKYRIFFQKYDKYFIFLTENVLQVFCKFEMEEIFNCVLAEWNILLYDKELDKVLKRKEGIA